MSETCDRAIISAFFNRFSAFEQKTVLNRFTTDKGNFNALFEAFALVDKRLEILLLTTVSGYNIFEALKISYNETKLHTPFLTHLLDPTGSHREGRVFFDSFLDIIFCKGYSSTVSNIEIKDEYSCSRGRIDILILYQIDKQKKALVIENKIYHHDEENQLARYYEYLTLELKLAKGDYHLVYLTPHKAAPWGYSISKQEYDKLRDDKSLSEIGYRQDIAPWLENITRSVNAQNVKDVLFQYIKTIKAL